MNDFSIVKLYKFEEIVLRLERPFRNCNCSGAGYDWFPVTYDVEPIRNYSVVQKCVEYSNWFITTNWISSM